MRRVMKAVSVSAELATIEKAVEGATLIIEIGRQGGIEDEHTGTLASAILSLAAVRLRDLGRAAWGTLDAETFWAPHNEAIDSSDEEDLILYPAKPTQRTGRR